MADSIEQKIVNAVVARLQTILTANGYVTSIGTTVQDSRTNWDQLTELPAISVFQGTVQPVDYPSDRRKTIRVMPLLIKAFFETKDTSTLDAAYARNVIKDIHKAILSTGAQSNGYLPERWPAVANTAPGLAMETREKSHGIEYAPDTFEVTGAQVEIEIVYISGKFNLEA